MNEDAERIYNEALDLEPRERAAFLEHECAGNQSLLRELTSLLEHSENAAKFFGTMSTDILPAMAADAVIGRTIGHYRIVSHIDEGGTGSVYRAIDTRLDREVALKLLPRTNASNALSEAKHAAALKHPNVCVIHDIGETDDGRPFIAMELCEGETLGRRLNRGSLNLDDTLSVAKQIAKGLAAAHERGIVHGDVKPANVILGNDGTVKLLDFGLAQTVNAARISSGLHGTLPYMSPEQVTGKPASERTDLWSLGVVIYEMITGTRPFRGGNDTTLIESILYGDATQDIPGIPSRLQSVIDRLLARNPGDRYSSASAVANDLASAGTASSTSRRSPIVLVASLAAVLILVILGVSSWRAKSATPGRNVSEQRRLTKNIAAYELYNRGRDPTWFRTDSGPLKGLALLQQAVALDSTFAGAYAAMTYMYFVLAQSGSPDSVRALQRLAESDAIKSIALDPSLPEAWMGLGIAKSIGMENLIEAEAAMKRAVDLGGAPRVHEHLGQMYLWRGKIDEAVAEFRQATNDDPLSATASAELAHALCLLNQTEQGLAMLERVRNLQPRLRRVPAYRGECFIMQHKWQEAITAINEEPASTVGSGLVGFSLARSGARDSAERMRNDLARKWDATGRGAVDAAMISAGLDQKDEFFKWLNRAAQSAWLFGTITSPYFSSMHSDPRFAEFRQRHNF